MLCCKQGAAGSPQFCCQRRRLWILREADWDANLCTCNRVMCILSVVSRCVRRHKVSKLGLETCTCVLQTAFVQRAVCSGVARMKVMPMTS